jgi:hypothetical protein
MLSGSSPWRLLAHAPVVAFAAYVVAFLAQARDIVRTLYLNADIASGPVIAQLLPAAPPDREVVLGNYLWAEALALQRLLDALPADRVLLEAAPFGFGLLTAGLTAYAVLIVARDRWAAAMAVIIVLAAGATVWACLGTWTVHGLTWLHVTILGVFVVWLEQRPRTTASAAAVAVPVGVVTGVGAASDPIVAIAGLAPMALVALTAARRGARSASSRALVLCLLVSGLGALASVLVARSADVRAAGTLPIRVTPLDSLDDNAGLVLQALADVANGRFVDSALGVSTVAHAAIAALAATAVVASGWWTCVRLRRADLTDGARAHVVFWSASAVALLAAVTLTTVPVDATASRYLVGVLLALAAVLPLLGAGARTRGLIGAGVAAYVCVGVVSLARGEFTANGFRAPTAETARALARLAAEERVGVAYSGYWDAAPLTWGSELAVRVYPVRMCDDEGRPCPFDFHRISTWYRPRAGRRSMLIADRTIRALAVTRFDPKLGAPAAVRRIGQLEVAIYDDDIARRFGPPAD